MYNGVIMDKFKTTEIMVLIFCIVLYSVILIFYDRDYGIIAGRRKNRKKNKSYHKKVFIIPIKRRKYLNINKVKYL